MDNARSQTSPPRIGYAREPGGMLFEIATHSPGFTADEPPDQLGTRLILPNWLEPQRTYVQSRLSLCDSQSATRTRCSLS